MSGVPHRIRRLRWHVRARSQTEAFTLRSRLRADLDETLQPALARAFDEIAPGDEVIHLSRLEIRARVSSLDELAEVLPDLVRRELHDRLHLPPSLQPASHEAAHRMSGERSRHEALVHYLRTGTLLWPMATWSRDPAAAWPGPLTVAEAAAAATALLASGSLDRASPAPWFRLLQLLVESEWASLAPIVAGAISRVAGAEPVHREQRAPTEAATPHHIADPSVVLAALVATGTLTRHARLTLAALAIAASHAASDPAATTALVATTTQILGTSTGAIADLVASLPEPSRSFFASLLAVSATTTKPAPSASAQTTDRAPAPTRAPLTEPTTTPLPPEAILASLAPSRDRDTEQPFGNLVSSAGLVLLHPFIARFFDAVGIERLSPKEIAPAALPRAAALLLFLATGNDEAVEHELAFIKVLLGLDTSAPLTVGGGLLSAADREEAEALLAAVIEHWGALGATSPEGLRASFLARSGLLREQETDVRLQVESASYDVLLRALPWGLTVVRLPWMRKPIFVEWSAP